MMSLKLIESLIRKETKICIKIVDDWNKIGEIKDVLIEANFRDCSFNYNSIKVVL